LTEGPEQPEVNKVVQIVLDLLQLGVLDNRLHELSGVRLAGPGSGWKSAMRFILETRTERDTIFAVPGGVL
jgi:hypothetical protein